MNARKLGLKTYALSALGLIAVISSLGLVAKIGKGSNALADETQEVDNKANLSVTVTADKELPIHLFVKEPTTHLSREDSTGDSGKTIVTYRFQINEGGEYRFYLQADRVDSDVKNVRVSVRYRDGAYNNEQRRLMLPLKETSFEVPLAGVPQTGRPNMGYFLSVYYRTEEKGDWDENRFTVYPRKALKSENPGDLTLGGFANSAHVSSTVEITFENLIFPSSPKLAFEMRDQVEAMYQSGHTSAFDSNAVLTGNLFTEAIQDYGQMVRDSQSVTYSDRSDDVGNAESVHLIKDLDQPAESDDSEEIVKSVYDLGYAIEGAAEDVYRFDLGLLPGVGQFLDFCEAVTGKQYCHPDGKELSVTERAMSVAGLTIGNEKFLKKLEGDGGSDFQKAVKKIAEGREKMGESGWGLFTTLVNKAAEGGEDKGADREHIFKFLQEHPDASEGAVKASLVTDRATRSSQPVAQNPWLNSKHPDE